MSIPNLRDPLATPVTAYSAPRGTAPAAASRSPWRDLLSVTVGSILFCCALSVSLVWWMQA